jgi:hypothetical protein
MTDTTSTSQQRERRFGLSFHIDAQGIYMCLTLEIVEFDIPWNGERTGSEQILCHRTP